MGFPHVKLIAKIYLLLLGLEGTCKQSSFLTVKLLDYWIREKNLLFIIEQKHSPQLNLTLRK